MAMIPAVSHVDRVIIAHGTLALEELANNTLAILDVTKTLDQIMIAARLGVLQAADTAVKTRRDRKHRFASTFDFFHVLGLNGGNHINTARQQRVQTRVRVCDGCHLHTIQPLTGVAPVVVVARVNGFHTGLECIQGVRTSTRAPLIHRVLFDDLGLRLRQLEGHIRIG